MLTRSLIRNALVYVDMLLTQDYLRFRRTYQVIVRVSAPITITAITIFETWPTTSATWVQLLPRNQPAPIKKAF